MLLVKWNVVSPYLSEQSDGNPQGKPYGMRVEQRRKKRIANPVMGMDRGCNIAPRESGQTSAMVFLYEIIYRTFEGRKCK